VRLLKIWASHGCSLIRLAAFALCIKKLDTNGFLYRTGIVGSLLDEKYRDEQRITKIDGFRDSMEHYAFK